MSLKTIIALVSFLALQQMQGQVTFNPGLRAGFAFSTISEMHADYKTDFYLGGIGELNIGKRYSLQPEINYVRQGSNNVVRNYYDENTSTNRVEHLDLQLNYLSFSLLNKLTFKKTFQVQFGPAIDVLLNDNLVRRKEYNDFSFVTGIAYCAPSGFVFEARIKKGLLDVLDSGYYSNDSNNNYFFGDYNTNVNFQIGVSYFFKGK